MSEVEQFRFKCRDEGADEWSGWIDRYEDGRDNIEFDDDDEILEYQHRTVDRDHKQGDTLVSHDWDVPLTVGGVGGRRIGTARYANGAILAEIEDDRIAAQLNPGAYSIGMGQFSSPESETYQEYEARLMAARLGSLAYVKSQYTESTIKEVPVKDAGYITKDSGVRAEYASGMVRDAQDGKPRYDLVMPDVDNTEASLLFALFAEQARREGRLGDDDTTAIAILVDWYEHPRRDLALKLLTEIEGFEGARAQGYADLLLTRWAALMGRGAEKYGDRNWEKSDGTDGALDRARGSALRHGLQWWNRQTDEDHAAAVCFNVGAVDYYQGRQA